MPYIGNKPATTAVQIGADQVISSTIADGAIVKSDLNSSAAIAASSCDNSFSLDRASAA